MPPVKSGETISSAPARRALLALRISCRRATTRALGLSSFTDKETGLKKQVEVPKRIREWWFKNANGKVCLSIKYGTSVLELAKGKPSIEVASPDDLIKALETIKQAVENGELDSQIEQASTHLRAGFRHSV